MKLTIVGSPEEISKFIKSISEGDDGTEKVEKTTDEIGFLAEKKSPTTIGLRINKLRRL